jgi:hypothetical protein
MSRSADAPGWRIREPDHMTYLTNSLIPDGTLDGYQAITDALPDAAPAGMVARYVGMCDAGLAITVVWASRADADRFETEQLGPTLRRVMGPPNPDSTATFFSYEAVDVVFGPRQISV